MIPRQRTSAWQELEAILFCIRALSDVAGDREKPFISQCLQYLYEIVPRQPPRLVQTCVSLLGLLIPLLSDTIDSNCTYLGSYAHWLNSHDPAFIYKAIEFIMPCMQPTQPAIDPNTAKATSKNMVGAKPGLSAAPDLEMTAFRAFREICDSCRGKLVHMIDQLVASFLSDQFEMIQVSY
jgi:hypothetical protein